MHQEATYISGCTAELMGHVGYVTCLVEACLCIVVSGGRLSGSFVGWWSFGLVGFSFAGFLF